MNLTEKKSQETLAELKAWIDHPGAENFHFNEPNAMIQSMLKTQRIEKSIMVDLKSLHNWYGNNFVYSGLVSGDLSWQEQYFATGFYTAKIADVFARVYPLNPPKLLFTDLAMILANGVQAKWFDRSKEILYCILSGLGTKYLNGGLSFSKASWFITELANRCFDVNADLSGYNYPADLGVFQQVLDHWDTDDLQLADRLVTTLSDHHLHTAGFKENSPNDFSFVKEFVFAYEIIAWLSLRERMGIKNPVVYSHPLMQLPINQFSTQEVMFRRDEDLERVLQKLNEAFPV